MGIKTTTAALSTMADRLDEAVGALRDAIGDLAEAPTVTADQVGRMITTDSDGDQVFWCTMCECTRYEGGRAGGMIVDCRRDHPGHVRRLAWLR